MQLVDVATNGYRQLGQIGTQLLLSVTGGTFGILLFNARQLFSKLAISL